MVKFADISRIRRLDDRTVRIFGLTDAHGHLALLGEQAVALDLAGARSYADVLGQVARAAATQPVGWIIGYGWENSAWSDPRWPDGRSLEQVAPGRAVLLHRIDTHAALVSPAGLAAAGIAATTPDPPGGKIMRDAAGAPTGGLIDLAIPLVLQHLPPPSQIEQRQRLQGALNMLAACGLTCVQDMRLSPATFEALCALAQDGALPLRVYAALDSDDPAYVDWLQCGPYRSPMLHVGAAKFFADGALGSRGAALLEPYADDSGNRGILLHTENQLTGKLRQAMTAGFQPIVHAIGDAANRLVLDCFTTVQREDPAAFAALRPRIEHVQVLHPNDLARLAALGVIASVQPIHAVNDAAWAPHRLGPVQTAHAYPYAALIGTGCALACGSDFPIASPDPWHGMAAALRAGLTLAQTVHGWTAAAQWAGFIDAAADGDFTDVDIDTAALESDYPEEICAALENARVLQTVVNDRVIFTRSPAQ